MGEDRPIPIHYRQIGDLAAVLGVEQCLQRYRIAVPLTPGFSRQLETEGHTLIAERLVRHPDRRAVVEYRDGHESQGEQEHGDEQAPDRRPAPPCPPLPTPRRVSAEHPHTLRRVPISFVSHAHLTPGAGRTPAAARAASDLGSIGRHRIVEPSGHSCRWLRSAIDYALGDIY